MRGNAWRSLGGVGLCCRRRPARASAVSRARWCASAGTACQIGTALAPPRPPPAHATRALYFIPVGYVARSRARSAPPPPPVTAAAVSTGFFLLFASWSGGDLAGTPCAVRCSLDGLGLSPFAPVVCTPPSDGAWWRGALPHPREPSLLPRARSLAFARWASRRVSCSRVRLAALLLIAPARRAC